MADDLITFVIDGGDARNGNVSATVFADKLKAFLSAMYGLERAFSNASKRQLDFEIVNLSKNSPNQVAMRARSKAVGYDADAAARWSVDQLAKIRAGQADRRIPESVLSTVVSLADYRTDKASEISLMKVQVGEVTVPLDGVLAGMAMAARARTEEAYDLPWRAGVSKGSVFGELMGVMDVDGGRRFYIRPPSGPSQIQCIFDESLRPQMIKNLFGVVRATGFLHYDGKSAHPHLVEAENLEGEAPPTVHPLDLAGAFPDLIYEPFVGELA